jgi:ParB family transcriptional regulator, chromosome partitioning protein
MAKRSGLPDLMKMKHDRHLVDEISSRGHIPVIRSVPIEKIIPGEFQPRKEMGELEDLTQSIREKGIIEPIIVRPKSGHFEIIAGERRFHAAQEAGLTEVPCIEHDVPDNEALELSIIENIQRKDLSVFEEAGSLKSLAEIYGYTHEEIGQKIGRSRVTVTEMIRIMDIPAALLERCQTLKINSKSFLLQLAKLETQDEMESVLDEYENGALSRDELRERRQENQEEKPVDAGEQNNGKAQPVRFRFVSEDKQVKIRFDIRGNQDRDSVIRVLEKLIQEIREGRVPDLSK